jgi:hypothetical protein
MKMWSIFLEMALAAIEAWEGSILSVIDPWLKFRLLS